MPVLDFKELSQNTSPAGEDLEALIRELGRRLDLKPEWTGRGADRGRDLYFTERRKGALGAYEVRWIVSCKDFAQSGRSVSENDVGSVSDKIRQHNAQGFLLATTTTASTGLKAMLDGINNPGLMETQVWDRHELENLLLQDIHIDLVKRFLPSSYTVLKRFTSLPLALQALDVLLPATISEKIQKVIDTYQMGDSWLTGNRIWPHDRNSSETIDLALAALLDQNDAVEAANILISKFIEFDAFDALLNTLCHFKSDRTQDLCLQIIKTKDRNGASFNAFKFYVNQFEPDATEQISIAMQLSSDDLHELYADEISAFVDDELTIDPARYQAWGELDALSSNTRVKSINPNNIAFTANAEQNRIDYSSSVSVLVSLTYDRQEARRLINFPGNVSGYINAHGMFIEDFIVNTESFYD